MKSQRIVKHPIVAISYNEQEGNALNECLNLLPVPDIMMEGKTIVITPNFVKSLPPQTGTVTGNQTLKTLIQRIKTYNPGRICIAVGSGGDPTTKVMSDQGFDKIIEEEKVEFIDLNYGPYINMSLDLDHPSATPINKLIEETDVLISFTQVKMHREATVSLGIKNIALSWPPAEIHGFPKVKRGIHENLHEFIAAMGKKIPIDLTILSASPAMIGTGPSEGKPVYANLVIAGTDPVATDVVGCRLLGFLPPAVSYLHKLIKNKVGEGDLNNVTITGLPLAKAEEIFSMAAYNFNIALDKDQIKPLHT